MDSLLGDNLIFMISQPRAGSTMLQRILGSHPDIHTVSEPWLMLQPLYAMKSDGYEVEYDTHPAQEAVRSFVQTLPGGEDDYIEGMRRMYNYLYRRSLASSGKRYFLDKTPRYYFIIPELYRVFPEARYVILLRNPLAVLCSILNTWVKKNWLSLYRFRHDLTRAPRLLLKGMEMLGQQCVVVHYEELVDIPESEMRRVCGRLGIDFVPEIVEYGGHDLSHLRFGDQKEVYQHTRPVSQNAKKWVQALDDPQVWRLANDYLQLLGRETVKQMGYSYEELRQVLEAHRPRHAHLSFTFSLAWLLTRPVEGRRRWKYRIIRLARLLERRGIRGSAVSAVRRIVRPVNRQDARAACAQNPKSKDG